MWTRKFLVAAIAITAAAAWTGPAGAREIYLSPMAGYTTAANLELGEQDLDNVEVAGGLTLGGQIGFQANPGFAFEVSYMQQESHITVDGADVIGLKVGQLHGNFLFEKVKFGSSTRPYFLLGLGATFFNPEGSFEGDSRFSFSLGAGLKVDAGSKIGLKIQGKYNPTYLDEDWGGVWCDPFYCYEVADPDYLDQGEFTAGLIYKLGSSE